MKRLATYLYQVYIWLIFYPIGFTLTFLAGWLTVLASIIWNPRIASRHVAANWGKIIAWLTPMFVTVEGTENLDTGRTYVVVSNHQSQYDIFLVYGWLNLDLKWVMKSEIRKIPGVGIGCEKAGHIFVERGNPEQTRKAVSEALDRVRDGVGILFFAEGSRSINGKLRPFKKGAFRLATSQGLPILPVTIVGTRDIQRPKSMMIIPGKARLVIHPAIEVKGDGPRGIRELMTQTRDAIVSAMPDELK